VALADAYGADEMPGQVLATLEAALRQRPRDRRLPDLAAQCLARWKLYEPAAALLARSIEASFDPAQYPKWVPFLVDYSRQLADGGPAERLARQWRLRVDSGQAELKDYLLLAQVLSQTGDLPGLRRLCESALARFPEERGFYDHLARALETAGDLAGLEAVRRRQLQNLPHPTSRDYRNAAFALLLAGKPEPARQLLAEGLVDSRLSRRERRMLSVSSDALDALGDAVSTGTQAFASCSYEDAGASLSVDCAGKRLSYDSAGKTFRTVEGPAQSARLAEALLERFSREKFAALRGEQAAMTDDALIMLKAAGYIGP
jgi:tetratricopeptide (TPR) repeat protein